MPISFKQVRRDLADIIEPRSWGVGTTTATGATNTVVCSDFALSRGDQSGYESGWIYFTSGALAGQQRPIRRAGLDVSTGTFTVATDFTATTPSGAEFEVHLRYPVKRAAGTPTIAGYLEMVNNACERLWTQDDIAVAAVDNQTRYLLDTTTYPFLAETERVLDVIDQLDSDNIKNPTRQIWRLDDDAEVPALYLTAPYNAASGSFYLRVARPANTRVKISGVWTEVTPSALNGGQFGMAADADEVHARRRDILALAITESMNHLGMAQPMYQADEWERRRKYWASVAALCKFRRLPRRTGGRPVLRAVGIGGGLMGRPSGWGAL